MTPQLQNILKELRQRLEELYGERLEKLVLFGSQARGDAEPDSDIDVLVVLKGEVNLGKEVERTSDLRVKMSLEDDIIVNPVFISSERYKRGKTLLMKNILTEGVNL